MLSPSSPESARFNNPSLRFPTRPNTVRGPSRFQGESQNTSPPNTSPKPEKPPKTPARQTHPSKNKNHATELCDTKPESSRATLFIELFNKTTISPLVPQMALSDNEIKKAAKTRELQISPPVHINPAGIDLRIDRNLALKPHEQTLAASIEHVQLANNLVGILHLRSSLAREGLIASFALVDPGYCGQLTVSLYNAGARQVNLKRGERFIQLSLLRLTTPARKGYSGKYQNSRGVVASRRRGKSYSHRMERVIHATESRGA